MADDILKRFEYTPGRKGNSEPEDLGQNREAARAYAAMLQKLLPDGREKALAITNIEQAQMWGVAAIVRNRKPEA